MADDVGDPAPPDPGPSSTAPGAAADPPAPAADAPAAAPPAVLFKRPAARARGNLRRPGRAGGGGGGGGGSGGEEGGDDDDDGGAASLAAKRARPSAAAALLIASTRDARPPDAATAAAAAVVPSRFGGDRSRQSGRDELATAQLETETAFDRDNRAIREAVLAAGTAGTAPAGEYRGEKARTDYRAGFRRPDRTAGAEKGGGAHGPLRAPTTARTTVLVDYAPDICKDYKETGYCGYGDACKFMHDRGDYQAGWQIDAAWEAKLAKESADKAAADAWAEEGGGEGGARKEEGGAGDGLPFACLGCRVAWHARSRPVVTPCRHFFCEACALGTATSVCPACGKPTGGTFNSATAIEARVRREAAEAAAGKGKAGAGADEEAEEDKGGWS